ncbi:hypothetical protein D3C87_1768760 [compost metagenome]
MAALMSDVAVAVCVVRRGEQAQQQPRECGDHGANCRAVENRRTQSLPQQEIGGHAKDKGAGIGTHNCIHCSSSEHPVPKVG